MELRRDPDGALAVLPSSRIICVRSGSEECLDVIQFPPPHGAVQWRPRVVAAEGQEAVLDDFRWGVNIGACGNKAFGKLSGLSQGKVQKPVERGIPVCAGDAGTGSQV